MVDTWSRRVETFWAQASALEPEEALTEMRRLVDERPAADPDAQYELASVHDFLGFEEAAVPLYRSALAAGISGPRRPQAIVQLASTLRNLGQVDEAIRLLSTLDADDPVVGAAARAFLALALRDAARPDQALQVALTALLPTLPLYRRSLEGYIADLHRA